MKNIKVLGTGCANCKTTLKLISDQARKLDVKIELEKVEDITDIMAFGVMSTPGVVLNNKVVHAGGIPTADTIKIWLLDTAPDATTDTQSKSDCCS